MNKPMIGLVLGAALGALDGLSALLHAGADPSLREQIGTIVMGSTFKGVLAGVATGFFARKCRSLAIGILFGFAVAFALAFLVAYLQDVQEGKKYYLEIILPGSIVGAIVGFATQRYGTAPAAPAGARS
ncbi:MAG: hypothetical protein HUU35_14715 [Armatimonadetes bacterium]|nr:hypothetical protein [Planctomycetota bacterium]NUQ01098.1 hypothetical protein [Armatimonadota bacterium]